MEPAEVLTMDTSSKSGCQWHSLARLAEWEHLRFGMFIHFGLSTYAGQEIPDGSDPSCLYSPDRLDVDQWVSIARDAGMRYAILTAKHVSGHCLWPSRHTDYHVGNSPNRCNVVQRFVDSCRQKGVRPGLYYCSWDNHHKFGSFTPSDYSARYPHRPYTCISELSEVFTSRQYEDFQTAQLEELLTEYGGLEEVWIDIPGVLSPEYRQSLYEQIHLWQPSSVVMMNNGIGEGAQLREHYAWPTDLISIERYLPPSVAAHEPWRQIGGRRFYIPGEVCDTIGKSWFYEDKDRVRNDRELLGMHLVSTARGANFLLNVPPDRHGQIPIESRHALERLHDHLDRLT